MHAAFPYETHTKDYNNKFRQLVFNLKKNGELRENAEVGLDGARRAARRDGRRGPRDRRAQGRERAHARLPVPEARPRLEQEEPRPPQQADRRRREHQHGHVHQPQVQEQTALEPREADALRRRAHDAVFRVPRLRQAVAAWSRAAFVGGGAGSRAGGEAWQVLACTSFFRAVRRLCHPRPQTPSPNERAGRPSLLQSPLLRGSRDRARPRPRRRGGEDVHDAPHTRARGTNSTSPASCTHSERARRRAGSVSAIHASSGACAGPGERERREEEPALAAVDHRVPGVAPRARGSSRRAARAERARARAARRASSHAAAAAGAVRVARLGELRGLGEVGGDAREVADELRRVGVVADRAMSSTNAPSGVRAPSRDAERRAAAAAPPPPPPRAAAAVAVAAKSRRRA